MKIKDGRPIGESRREEQTMGTTCSGASEVNDNIEGCQNEWHWLKNRRRCGKIRDTSQTGSEPVLGVYVSDAVTENMHVNALASLFRCDAVMERQ